MPHRLSAVGLALLLLLSGCGVVGGSGEVQTETRQVSGFTAIDLAGSGEVTLEQGDSETLTIEADDNVLPRLTSEVSDSTLKLDKKRGITLGTNSPIRYRVTLKDLTGLNVSGSGSIKAERLTLQTLRVDISGSGTVDLSGSAVEQDIEVSGSGRYEAADLPSQKVTAEISGSGEIAVAVSGELKVDISGSGTVTYSGDPNVQQSVSGSGKVIKK
ncbi:MAG TPA: head GIN domain-containing protein [Propionibacteriaceae bacterium]|nr:head GIN domain-containing protein [Propionibacteriaceae bacterium]